MSEVRVDPLTGTAVVVVAGRQKRPNLPASGCPFCVGGLEAPEPYDVRWFPNRFPPFPGDRAELVLYTPVHDATFPSLGVDGAERVVSLWADRTEALSARPDVEYVLVFENRGPAAGATIAHPHGQIYAFDFVPEHATRELEQPSCALCAPPQPDFVVAESGAWTASVPWASAWPYELLIAPRAHVPSLPAARDSHRDAAAVLVDALGRLDGLFDAPMPYMLWWHQAPCDGEEHPGAHLHAHVAPILRAPGVQRFVAAGEVGSGVYFNPVPPEDAAAALRAVVL